jgi:hypothetical protein
MRRTAMKNGLLVAFFVTVISGVVWSGVAAEPAITQNELYQFVGSVPRFL